MGAERLGRYTLIRRLGAGGFGEVWEASVDRPSGPLRVALKRALRGGDALRREARVAALLRHRHLVDVFEVGGDGEEAWCAMELCALGSLAEHAPLSPRAVVEVGLAVCAALTFAHEDLGLVHLDLKPENLLLTGHGTPKVADLGLARAAGALDQRRLGTARYMAPEQRAGSAVDARTDVFGLGRTLEALATGWAPAGAATFDPDATGDGASAYGNVPPWLRDLVARATAADPADRYPSLSALAVDLARLPADGPPLAELPGVSPAEDPAGPRAPRAALVGAVRAALAAPGITTLTGPAGIGKSTIAELATDPHPDEVVWVPARGLDSARALLDAVAAELALPPDRGRTDAVGVALAARTRAVLVLDDVDRVPAEAGSLVAAWAARLPVLATARVATGWPAERCVAVPALDVPAGVDLLRALAAERGVRLPPSDPRVADLVDHLGGNPLAISLAAGRLGVIALDELSPSARWLRGGAEDGHASFAQALDDDWALLGAADREALAGLSVFTGAFDAEDAAAVLDDPGAVARLAARGLVSATRDGRWRLPEVVADHAALRRTGDAAVARHIGWFTRPGPALGRPETIRAERRRLPEVLAAVRRALGRGEVTAAIGGVHRLRAGIRYGGDGSGLRSLLAEIASLATRDHDRAEVAWLQAVLDRHSADFGPALGRAAQLAQDDPQRLRVLVTRAAAEFSNGDRSAAVRDATGALRLAEAAGDGRMSRMARGTLILAREEEDRAAARSGYEALAEEAAQDGDLELALRALTNAANLDLRDDRLDRAEATMHRALDLARALGDVISTALVSGNLGVVAGLRGDDAAARGWYQASEWASARAGQAANAAWWRVQRLRIDPADPAGAAAAAEAAAATLAAAGDAFGEVIARAGRAVALARLGRAAEADLELERAAPAATRIGPRAEARRRYADGEVRAARGDHAGARAAWLAAVRAAEELPDRPMARHAWIALARSPGPWEPGERAAVRDGLAAAAEGDRTGACARVLAAFDAASGG